MSSTGSGQPEMDSGGSRPQTAQAAQPDLAQMLDWAAAPGGSTLAPADLPDDASESHEPEIGGRYRLLEAIGEGGFGTVFRAQQTQPVRREVAIKLIKLGMDTRALIARFEAERQALAMMDHPSVAKVYDAGSTRQGRPFFARRFNPPWRHGDGRRFQRPALRRHQFSLTAACPRAAR